MSAPSGGAAGAAAAESELAPTPRPPQMDASLVNLQVRAADVLKRLEDLRRAVVELRYGVGEHRGAVWPQFLAKFSALAKLYVAFSEEFDRAMYDAGLSEFVVFPRQALADADAITETLRSRRDAAVEREEDALRKSFEATDAANAAGDLADRVSDFNIFVQNALERFHSLRKDLITPWDSESEPMVQSIPEENLLLAIQTGRGL